jgi:hypothetical protein
MNDRQNTVVATVVSGLILVVVFLCPWRVESSGELEWSPIYQPPMSYVRSYDADYGRQGGSRIDAEDAEIAVDILVVEVLALLVGGGLFYVFTSDSAEDNETT